MERHYLEPHSSLKSYVFKLCFVARHLIAKSENLNCEAVNEVC